MRIDRELLAELPEHEEVRDELAVRALLEDLHDRAGVVAVLVADEQPLHVLRLDQGKRLLKEGLAVHAGERVDQHRFFAPQHHRHDG